MEISKSTESLKTTMSEPDEIQCKCKFMMKLHYICKCIQTLALLIYKATIKMFARNKNI